MAFVCTLSEDAETPLTLLKGHGEYIIRAAIGYDDVTGNVFSAFVALSPVPGYAWHENLELVFSVIESDLTGTDISVKWDGLETKPIIGDPIHRALILHVICCAVERLIEEARPAVATMTTHTAGLPTNALRKFAEIMAVFARNGYEADVADSWHGRYLWMMRLQDGGTLSGTSC